MNTCQTCSREYEWKRSAGHTKTKCNSCQTNIRRFKLKEKCIDYLGGSCQLCGYKRFAEVLEFHHRDPLTKDFTISGNHSKSWEKISSELDKCELLCANCHRETHATHILFDPTSELISH